VLRNRVVGNVLISILTIVVLTPTASAMLHPGLGRFAQRDSLVYLDSLSLYAYERLQPSGKLDPPGTNCISNNSSSGMWVFSSGIGWIWVPPGGTLPCSGDWDMICPPAQRAVKNAGGGYDCYKLVDCANGDINDSPIPGLVVVLPSWSPGSGNSIFRYCCCLDPGCAGFMQLTQGGMQDTRNVAGTSLPPGYP
jgi:hypothetical protein